MKNLLLCVSLLLFACNPAKRLQKNSDQLQKLVDAVNAEKVLPHEKDSTVFINGAVVHVTDTLKLPGHDTDSTKYFYVNNYYYKTDSVKTFTDNPALQNSILSLSRDYERNKALYEAAKGQADEWRKYFLILIGGIVVSIILICVLKFK